MGVRYLFIFLNFQMNLNWLRILTAKVIKLEVKCVDAVT
jgi:hypothetical protein